jgi:hypothetical protein
MEGYAVPAVVECLHVAASFVDRERVVVVVPEASVPDGLPAERCGGLSTTRLTVMDSCLVAVACGESESRAWTVNVEVPVAVGVPDIRPAGERVRPAGREPVIRDHVYGLVPPIAERDCEYAELS